MNLSSKEAKKIGMAKTTLFDIKRKIKRNKELNLRSKTIEKIK